MTEATTTATAPVTAKSSAKALLKAIGMVRATGDKLNALIHETAMHAAKHAQDYGDPQYAQSLVMACPASMRRSMVILWFAKFTPIVVKDSDEWTAKMHKESSKLYVPFDLVAGNLEPFWLLAEQRPENVYDFDKLVEMVKRIGKQIENKIKDGKVKDEDIASAEGIVTTISGLNFVRIKPVDAPVQQPEPNNDKGSDKQEQTAGEQPALSETLGVELKNVA